MVIRPNQHWFFRLFDWHGSVLSKIIFRLCLNIAMSIIAILVYQWYELLGIHLTVAPFSLLGIAIAIFLGFRNNASYSRLVEARTLWGNMLITHRNILRNIKALLPEDKQFNRDFSNLLIAFSWSIFSPSSVNPSKRELRLIRTTSSSFSKLRNRIDKVGCVTWHISAA